MVLRLDPDIKHYDWGSDTHISEFLGQEPSGLPEAEAWFGSYPLSKTTIRDGGVDEPFGEWLRSRGSNLDILVKLLAAARPLSIQVHPVELEALQGYAQEQDGDIPHDSPHRVFKDPRSKPELIVALAPDFRLMVGAVDKDLLRRRLTELAVFRHFFNNSGVSESDFSDARMFVNWVLRRDSDVLRATEVLRMAIEDHSLAGMHRELGIDSQTMEMVNSGHPGDPGLLIAVAMHHVTLNIAEALFVAPGVPHAYVQGFGLELMLPSDNVVRAGLTSKVVQPESFLRLANLSGSMYPEIIRPSGQKGFDLYSSDLLPFELGRVHGGFKPVPLRKDSIILVENGSLLVGSGDNQQRINRGAVIFVEASEVIVPGEEQTTAWIATNGEPQVI